MSIPNLPFKPVRGSLYQPDELIAGFDSRPESLAETTDFTIYRYFLGIGGAATREPIDGMMQALHDNTISQVGLRFLHDYPRVTAIMGGHKMDRASADYVGVASLSRRLTRDGFLVASGGGPGAMEAAHLGALFADAEQRRVDDAVHELGRTAAFPESVGIVRKNGTVDADKLAALHAWYEPAVNLSRRVSDGGVSLAVPTWHYGHEPFSPLATHIAKYFQNSIREEGLLGLAADGIIFAPGKAGTLQEIFQDACQNYYQSFFDRFSCMIFFRKDYWTHELPVIPLLERLFIANGREAEYRDNVLVSDSTDEIAEFLNRQPAKELALLAEIEAGNCPDPEAHDALAGDPLHAPVAAVDRTSGLASAS